MMNSKPFLLLRFFEHDLDPVQGGRDIVLVYPKQIPESKTYTVTFKTDTGGRAYSSKADAQKVADNTVIVKLPRKFM